MSNGFQRTLALLSVLVIGGCWGGPNHTLGIQNGTLAPCPGTPNCVHTGLRDPEGTRPMFADTRIPRGQMMDRIADVVRELPRTEIISQDGDYLHAEVTSRFFRFVDDLEIMISVENEVIVRSAARVGKGDLGVNAARVEDLRERLQRASVIR